MTTFFAILIVILSIETCVLVLLGKLTRQVHNENLELKEEVARQKRNVSALVEHEKYLVELIKDKNKVAEEIKEAKTDEEIQNIINSLVGRNNDRVRYNTEG